ncbi:MAG: hypothetical protein OEZ35_04260 [Candidatus Bathyarchaeota archaeon]|nr:hypothetical protein [Candidatus Bathyarchaeota archaeon]
MYVVYVNHPNNKAIVHRETCRVYVHRRRDDTHNGYWRGLFEKLADAESFARSTGKKRIDTCAFCL